MYRRNYRYRSSIKSEFSPSLRKANTPNYYQRKGRTIQQTPLNMRNYPTEMITRKKLDEIYRMLVEYKYQFPTRPLPSINIPAFTIRYSSPLNQLFVNNVFGSEQLNTLGNYFIRTYYAEIANMYTWTFQLQMIQFLSNLGGDENKQYHIDWHSNLISGGFFQIFIKSLNIAILPNQYTVPITAKPDGYQSGTTNVIMRVDRGSITNSGGISPTASNVISNDQDMTDDFYYPFIDTSAAPDNLYYGSLSFVPSTGMEEGEISNTLNTRIFFVCIPHSQ